MEKMNKWIISFIGIEMVLYILFLWVTSGIVTSLLQYLSIMIVFLWVVVIPIKGTDQRFVQVALFLTLIADYFLVIQGSNKEVALIFFNFVQIMYALRLYYHNSIHRWWRLGIRLGLMVLSLVIAMNMVMSQFDLLLGLTMVYFVNMVVNMMEAIFTDQKNWLFGCGLLLFIGCDIVVGLWNSQGYIIISQGSFFDWLIHIPINLAWVFYLPSQVFIALSVIRKKTTFK
ncbi:MAG: lysoplasmalogenase family protein [Bacilli bacterium]